MGLRFGLSARFVRLTNRLMHVTTRLIILTIFLFLISCTGKHEQLIIQEFPQTQIQSSVSNKSSEHPSPEQSPEQACINLCLEAKQQGINLDNGPCLSDFMNWSIPNYVCDVAHWPRQAVDNIRENQCNVWHAGLAEHFVEVNPECKFIRKV